MKHFLFLLTLSLLYSCNSYDCGDLKFKNGQNFEKSTGKPANGKYQCIETRGSGMTHKTIHNYEDGFSKGKWEYYCQGDLIQNGEYLNQDEFKKSIKELTKAKTVDIEAWYEGNYGRLYIDLYSPQTILDTLKASKLHKQFGEKICKQYNLEDVFFRQKIESGWLKTISLQ